MKPSRQFTPQERQYGDVVLKFLHNGDEYLIFAVDNGALQGADNAVLYRDSNHVKSEAVWEFLIRQSEMALVALIAVENMNFMGRHYQNPNSIRSSLAVRVGGAESGRFYIKGEVLDEERT